MALAGFHRRGVVQPYVSGEMGRCRACPGKDYRVKATSLPVLKKRIVSRRIMGKKKKRCLPLLSEDQTSTTRGRFFIVEKGGKGKTLRRRKCKGPASLGEASPSEQKKEATLKTPSPAERRPEGKNIPDPRVENLQLSVRFARKKNSARSVSKQKEKNEGAEKSLLQGEKG